MNQGLDLLKQDLRDWSRYLDTWESTGYYTLRPNEIFQLSLMLETAADAITELECQRDMHVKREVIFNYDENRVLLPRRR
ncbi:MAG: hypothetical protein IJD99_08730 [Clostridia bacterium]|nr:hypothetical protein [Clostridia bacterium]